MFITDGSRKHTQYQYNLDYFLFFGKINKHLHCSEKEKGEQELNESSKGSGTFMTMKRTSVTNTLTCGCCQACRWPR